MLDEYKYHVHVRQSIKRLSRIKLSKTNCIVNVEGIAHFCQNVWQLLSVLQEEHMQKTAGYSLMSRITFNGTGAKFV